MLRRGTSLHESPGWVITGAHRTLLADPVPAFRRPLPLWPHWALTQGIGGAVLWGQSCVPWSNHGQRDSSTDTVGRGKGGRWRPSLGSLPKGRVTTRAELGAGYREEPGSPARIPSVLPLSGTPVPRLLQICLTSHFSAQMPSLSPHSPMSVSIHIQAPSSTSSAGFPEPLPPRCKSTFHSSSHPVITVSITSTLWFLVPRTPQQGTLL